MKKLVTRAGIFARLALISCASAAATALISARFMAPAAAMVAETVEPPAAPGTDSAPRSAAAAVAPAPALDIIRRVENADMQVAFTFDACATRTQPNGFDRPVFRVLQREGVPATVFTSGRWVDSHPEAMRQLSAEPLIEFANHSYDHPHMDRLTPEQMADEIDRTEVALGRYGRQSVAFRPPFGDFNHQVLAVARERRLPAVLWDVVSGDPSAGATAEAMIRSVVRETRAGSIIIFHINGRETKTAAALPPIFRQLRARGFRFVHLSRLLAAPSTTSPGQVAGPTPASPDDDEVMPLSYPEDLEGVDSSSSNGGAPSGAGATVTRGRARRRIPVSMVIPAAMVGRYPVGADTARSDKCVARDRAPCR